MPKELRLLHILSFQEMLWQNRHCHIIQKCHIRCIQLKCDRMIIHHINFLHIFIIRCIFRTVIRIHNRLDGKFHIISCKIFPVMPLYTLFQMKCICVCRFIKFPALGKPRYNLIITVMRCQSIKQQDIDLSMFIHRRIDPRIIIASIN